MQNKIKKLIERNLVRCIRQLDKTYSLSKISPLLARTIRDFALRSGKRLRPALFVVGYLGFARRPAKNLYQSALSMELLHDFMLVHDDIIDKSALRRGKPAMHKMFQSQLKGFKQIKFSGEDLAIVAGDVIYALAIEAFLSIKENRERKERALRRFIRATVYTATGEFIELMAGTKDISKLTKEDIYKIYEYKTAHYSFASPLSIGAILAGAAPQQVQRLNQYGLYLGRAFQIKDDILGIFGQQKKTGKSSLVDLQEGKKTILIWCAYHNADEKTRRSIKRILSKRRINRADLAEMRKIITASGALKQAEKEISGLLNKAARTIAPLTMRRNYKELLINYSEQLLTP